MKDLLLWFGSLLTLTGLFGFTAVSDDLRHPGELIAISAVLLFGIILIAVAIHARRTRVPVPSHPGLWFGAALILLGIVGFGFVADDLSHVLEIYISGAVLLAGLILFAFSWRQRNLPSSR
ncbi:MAG: hypothetical protein IPG71_02805 [bacterium]|nr:hypothetical protein [bacterium]